VSTGFSSVIDTARIVYGAESMSMTWSCVRPSVPSFDRIPDVRRFAAYTLL